MALSVKKIVLWRRETDDRPGLGADTVGPLAGTGASLRIVMGYKFPSEPARAAVEVWPVAGKKAMAAAQQTGLAAMASPSLLVEGDDRPGLGHAFLKALADGGINLDFLVALVVGRKFSAVFGFKDEGDLKAATPLLKRAAKPPKK